MGLKIEARCQKMLDMHLHSRQRPVILLDHPEEVGKRWVYGWEHDDQFWGVNSV